MDCSHYTYSFSNKKHSKNHANHYFFFEYRPGGFPVPGRSENSSQYRYGFGGHEKDDEISGSGNHYSFGDMGYDPRIVRRLSIDPLAQKNTTWSPYVYALNNPLGFVDENGEWPGVTYLLFI